MNIADTLIKKAEGDKMTHVCYLYKGLNVTIFKEFPNPLLAVAFGKNWTMLNNEYTYSIKPLNMEN